MDCPYCGETITTIIETRRVPDVPALRRRHECSMCLKRWTTYEVMKEDWDRMVRIKKGIVTMVENIREELRK